MTQYSCILSAAVTSVKVKQVFIPPGRGLDQPQEFPPPRFLIVEDDANRPEAGALLYWLPELAKDISQKMQV